MASNVLILLFFAGIFTIAVGFERCSMFSKDAVYCHFWKSEICCGNCDKSYCCSDPQKIFTSKAQSDCHFKDLRIFPNYSSQSNAVSIAIGTVFILGLVAIFILLICWVNPRCYLYKRFRNPRPVATVVTGQYHPQPSAIIQGGQYNSYQALPSNPPHGGQPMSTGPPPSYQEAGPGYSVPIQVAHDGGQAMFPLQSALPTDYTSPQPAYNPAYTGFISPVVKTSN
ncbi:protein shisa-5-like isoform X2 [Puntigrus tetrazona]|uniref:protein shisa-5-like isoform X2 n=1 Tax=Puntigrus tetrazona TaxID=1606681 RepID=UPI001C8AA3FE|nr:protein shisa-5-like isoform X2 [Puntigrus tetrazona]